MYEDHSNVKSKTVSKKVQLHSSILVVGRLCAQSSRASYLVQHKIDSCYFSENRESVFGFVQLLGFLVLRLRYLVAYWIGNLLLLSCHNHMFVQHFMFTLGKKSLILRRGLYWFFFVSCCFGCCSFAFSDKNKITAYSRKV